MSYESISHSRWDCKYHVVFIPKCRRKELYGTIRKFLGPVFHEMTRDKGFKMEEGYIGIGHPWGGSQPPSSPLCGDVMTSQLQEDSYLIYFSAGLFIHSKAIIDDGY